MGLRLYGSILNGYQLMAYFIDKSETYYCNTRVNPENTQTANSSFKKHLIYYSKRWRE
ncbi:hypothetical protein D3C78_1925400 [compost metagenome]